MKSTGFPIYGYRHNIMLQMEKAILHDTQQEAALGCSRTRPNAPVTRETLSEIATGTIVIILFFGTLSMGLVYDGMIILFVQAAMRPQHVVLPGVAV